MELIIAILFFSLASTVCIQLFVKSYIISTDTVDKNNSIIQAQNLAESYLGFEGDFTQIARLFPNAVLNTSADELSLYFDKDWTPSDSDSANYIVVLCQKKSDVQELIAAEIIISSFNSTKEDSIIYSLPLLYHIPEQRGQDNDR